MHQLFICSCSKWHSKRYQAEVGGSYNYLDPDNGSSVSKFGVDGTYYFNPVQTRNAPLAEAAFLNRASNVNAHVNYGDNSGTKDTQYGVGVEYFVPNSDFYLSGDVGRNEREIDNTNIDSKVTTYAAEGLFTSSWFITCSRC